MTHWAKYTSTEAGVATIDDEGIATVTGNGETAITVWFASKVAIATISVPNEKEVPAEVFAKSPQNGFIDRYVLDKLERLRIPPSGTCTEYLAAAPEDIRWAVPARARPAAATTMIEKVMIAITHGVGPWSGRAPSSRRSDGEVNSQPNIIPAPRAGSRPAAGS